jgi:hypothetical protein
MCLYLLASQPTCPDSLPPLARSSWQILGGDTLTQGCRRSVRIIQTEGMESIGSQANAALCLDKCVTPVLDPLYGISHNVWLVCDASPRPKGPMWRSGAKQRRGARAAPKGRRCTYELLCEVWGCKELSDIQPQRKDFRHQLEMGIECE